MKEGDLQLTWGKSGKTVAGYKVYQFGADGRKRLGTSTPSYSLVKKPSEGYANLCFAVEAYVGSQTSKDSSQYCYAPGATAATRSFKPDHTVTQVSWQTETDIRLCPGSTGAPAFTLSKKGTDNSGPLTAFFPGLLNEQPNQGRVGVSGVCIGNAAGILNVKWNISLFNPCFPKMPSGSLTTGPMTINAFAGTACSLGELTGHKLYSAVLTLNPSQTVAFASGKFTLSKSGQCPMWVQAANREWWLTPLGNLIYNKSGQAQIENRPANNIDVSSIVSAWASVKYANNYGCIVENNPPSGAVPITSFACLTKFSNPSLQVVYFLSAAIHVVRPSGPGRSRTGRPIRSRAAG